MALFVVSFHVTSEGRSLQIRTSKGRNNEPDRPFLRARVHDARDRDLRAPDGVQERSTVDRLGSADATTGADDLASIEDGSDEA